MKPNYLKPYGISPLGNYYNFVGIPIVNKNRLCTFYLQKVKGDKYVAIQDIEYSKSIIWTD